MYFCIENKSYTTVLQIAHLIMKNKSVFSLNFIPYATLQHFKEETEYWIFTEYFMSFKNLIRKFDSYV